MNEYNKTEQRMFYDQRIGTVYGCFEVVGIEYDEENKRQVWTMRCIHCGMEKKTHNGKDYVKGKNAGNCKCQHIRKKKEKPKKEKRPKMSDHKLYRRWEGIKQRCYCKADKNYKNYGGRGIKVCEEWKRNFMAFAEWAEKSGFKDGLTIDRIDNNGDYCPENCRWADSFTQNSNKRNIKLYDGLTVAEIARMENVKANLLRKRLKDGLSIEKAIEDIKESKKRSKERENIANECASHGVPYATVESRMKKGMELDEAINYRCGYEYMDGQYRSKDEWCSMYGITKPAVAYRMKHGMTFEEAVKTPKKQGGKFLKALD